jgi:hypothetical protein
VAHRRVRVDRDVLDGQELPPQLGEADRQDLFRRDRQDASQNRGEPRTQGVAQTQEHPAHRQDRQGTCVSGASGGGRRVPCQDVSRAHPDHRRNLGRPGNQDVDAGRWVSELRPEVAAAQDT